MRNGKVRQGSLIRLKKSVVRNHRCPPNRINNTKAVVQALLSDIPGGFMTAEDLRGCRYWNEEDVVVIKY